MHCTIWYNLCNLINVKSTHGGVLLLVKLQAKSLHRCFLPFLNCTNGTKLCKTSHCLSVSYFYTVCLSYTVLTVYLSAERLLSFLPIFGEHVKFLSSLYISPCLGNIKFVVFRLLGNLFESQKIESRHSSLCAPPTPSFILSPCKQRGITCFPKAACSFLEIYDLLQEKVGKEETMQVLRKLTH